MADRKQGAGWSSGSSAAGHHANCSSLSFKPQSTFTFRQIFKYFFVSSLWITW